MKGKQSTIAWIIISLIVFVIELLVVSDNPTTTRYFEFQLLLLWSIALFLSYKKFGILNLYTLFLLTTMIFSIGGVLHFFVSGESICVLEDRGFGDYVFSHSVIQKTLIVYTIFIWISYLTYQEIYTPKVYELRQRNEVNNLKLQKIGITLMYAFLAIEIYKGYLYVSTFSISRVLIYLYGSMENPIPRWVRLLATFYEVGYFFIIASKPDKKIFKKFSLLYFVAIIPEIILGNRAMFGAFLLFYLWYYNKFYKAKAIKTKYLVIGGAVMLLVFQMMEFYRNGLSLSGSSYSLTSFLVGQSISFYILPFYMVYSGSIQYYLYPFVLYTFLGGFSGYTGQSIEVLEHKCGVGHQLMYAINPDYYLAGASIGSSSITELYDLGLWGVIAGAILLPYMIRFFDRKMQTSTFVRFVSFTVFSDIVLSPRGSFFPGAYGIVKLYLFYIAVMWAFSFIYKSKSNEIKLKE